MILETTDSSHMSAKELTAYHESSLFFIINVFLSS